MSPPPRSPAGRPRPPGGNGPTGRPLPSRPLVSPAAGRGAPPARPGAAQQPQAQRGIEEDLEPRFDRLDRRIQQLKVDFNRYFAGDLPLPPTPLRDEIEAELRRLRGVNLRRTVDSFRFGSLEAQFNSYSEMFSRRLRAREEGKVAVRPTARQAPGHDVDAGVVVGSKLEPDAVEALFQGLVHRNPRGATMDLDTFRTYLQRQVSQIRDKTGCTAVQFRVVTEEGKVKLKAKPVGAAAGGGS